MFQSAKDLQNQALRDAIKNQAAKLPKEQLAFLHRIHDNAPWKGLDNCPDDKLALTYDLICRSLVKRGIKT